MAADVAVAGTMLLASWSAGTCANTATRSQCRSHQLQSQTCTFCSYTLSPSLWFHSLLSAITTLRVQDVPSHREVNKPALWIGGDQFDSHPVAYVEALAALDDHAIHVRVEGADEGAVMVTPVTMAGSFGRCAGAARHGRCASAFRAQPAGVVFHQRATTAMA